MAFQSDSPNPKHGQGRSQTPLTTALLIGTTVALTGYAMFGDTGFGALLWLGALITGGYLLIPAINSYVDRINAQESARVHAGLARGRVVPQSPADITPRGPISDPSVATISQTRDALVRAYRGADVARATVLFQRDAGQLARDGWSPRSQDWSSGTPGAGRVLAIGLLAFAARPKGTLTVFYGRTEKTSA